MGKYRKKTVVIEAWQLPEIGVDATEELKDFLHSSDDEILSDRDGGVIIETLAGVMRGNPGDWIIKGVNGEFYPCNPDVFEATYEAVLLAS